MKQLNSILTGVAAAGLVLAGMFLERHLSRAEAQDADKTKQIKGHEIVLVDQDGVPRIGIKAEKNSTSGFFIYDAQGLARASMALDKNGKASMGTRDLTEDGKGLEKDSVIRAGRFEVVDVYGQARVTCGMVGDSGAVFKMTHAQMKDTLTLQVDELRIDSPKKYSVSAGRTGVAVNQTTLASGAYQESIHLWNAGVTCVRNIEGDKPKQERRFYGSRPDSKLEVDTLSVGIIEFGKSGWKFVGTGDISASTGKLTLEHASRPYQFIGQPLPNK